MLLRWVVAVNVIVISGWLEVVNIIEAVNVVDN